MIFLLLAFVLAAASPLYPQPPAAAGKANLQSGTKAAKNLAQQGAGGMADAGSQKAVFDNQHRPITAGGFVKTGPIIFEDVAKAAGLTSWHHTAGTHEKRLLLEAKGPGVCLLDYDNDGWLDIYLVNGSTYVNITSSAVRGRPSLQKRQDVLGHGEPGRDVSRSRRRAHSEPGLAEWEGLVAGRGRRIHPAGLVLPQVRGRRREVCRALVEDLLRIGGPRRQLDPEHPP